MASVRGDGWTRLGLSVAIVCVLASTPGRARQDGSTAPGIPSGPLAYGVFTARFNPDGSLSIEGQGWPPLKGT